MNSTLLRKRKVDYCEILGVPLDADEQVVKKAYRKLALEYHPDRPSNKYNTEESSKKFTEIQDAYNKLQESSTMMNTIKSTFKSSDLQQTLDSLYFGTNATNYSSLFSHTNTTSSTPHEPSTAATPDVPMNINSIGTGVAYKMSQKPNPKRGQSLKAILHLNKEESSAGCQKTIEYMRTLYCKDCDGSGNSKLSTPPVCTDCDGKGFKTTTINGLHLGSNSITAICRKCHSTGHLSAKDCSPCNGSGKTTIKKNQSINVAAGCITGNKLVFDGEGDEGLEGGPTGDLILWFEVEGTPLVEAPVREVKKRGRKPGSTNRKNINLSYPVAAV